MRFDSEFLGLAAAWLGVAVTLCILALLLLFIFLRRLIRARWFRVRDRRGLFVRQHWNEIVSGAIPADTWFFQRVDRQIVEEIALDRMDLADGEEAERLTAFLRDSGLMDRYKYDARKRRGWHRRQSLLTLGRMRAPESVPILIETLEDGPDEDTVSALRALGRIGSTEAGTAIVRRLDRPLPCPREVVELALTTCFRHDPDALVNHLQFADDPVRPVLARVLAEVALPGIADGWSTLISDPLPEVRAAAARILAIVQPTGAAMVLAMLTEDPEWFVRLRATVALGELADPYTIPVLIERLCDSNRLVRLRAASALVRMKGSGFQILTLASRTEDRYALQALVSEFERSGKITRMVDGLAKPGAAVVHAGLMTAVRGGAVRLLADLAQRHPDEAVRRRLNEILEQVEDPVAREYLAKLGESPAEIADAPLTRESTAEVAKQPTGKGLTGRAIPTPAEA
jgi:hypothetical protein